MPTDLETALPRQSLAANAAPPVRRMGLLESLTAPGVSAVVPASSETATIARNVLAAVGAAAQVTSQLGNIADEQRREIEADVRKTMVEADHRGELGLPLDPSIKHTEIIRAHRLARARFEAGKMGERVENDAAEGNFAKLLQPGEDVPAAVSRLIAEATPDASDEERAVFTQSFTPRAMQTIRRAREAMFEQTFADATASLAGGIASAAEAGKVTQETADQFIQQATNIGKAFRKTEAESLATLMPAIKAVALRGDSATLEKFLPVLKQHFPDDAEILIARAGAAQAQRRNEQADAFIQRYAQMTALPVAIRRRAIESAAKSNQIDPSLAGQLNEKLDRERAGMVRDAQQQHADALQASIVTGSRGPGELLTEIGNRVAAFEKNPGDPAALDPSRALHLQQQLTQRVQFDDSLFRVGEALTGKPQPLTAGDDKAIVQTMQSIGVLDAGGNPTTNEGAALVVAKLGRVPKHLTDWMNAGASSDNPETVARAAALYWTMRRTAPDAMREAGKLNDTARLRLAMISSGLDQESPATIADALHKPSPAFQQRVLALARGSLPVNAKAMEGIDRAAMTRTLLNIRGDFEKDAAAQQAFRKAWSDADFDMTQAPPALFQKFTDAATDYYAALSAAGWSRDTARDQAFALAAYDIDSDYIITNLHGQLWMMPRHDSRSVTATDEKTGLPVALEPLRWTPTAGSEWKADFAEAQKAGRISADADFDDWRPTTLPGVRGFRFVKIDDPLIALTDKDGRPVEWQPQTRYQKAEKARAQAALVETKQAAKFRQDVIHRKANVIEWVVIERGLRDNGRPYSPHLDKIDNLVTEKHLRWLRAKLAEKERMGFFDALEMPSFGFATTSHAGEEPPDSLIVPEDELKRDRRDRSKP